MISLCLCVALPLTSETFDVSTNNETAFYTSVDVLKSILADLYTKLISSSLTRDTSHVNIFLNLLATFIQLQRGQYVSAKAVKNSSS